MSTSSQATKSPGKRVCRITKKQLRYLTKRLRDIDVEIAKAFVLQYVGEHESAQAGTASALPLQASCYRDLDRSPSPPPYRTV